MNQEGLLPLSHISKETQEALETYAQGKGTEFSRQDCLYIVEAILNDPPALYEKYKGSSEWILKFHRGAIGWMEAKIREMKSRRLARKSKKRE